jgi:septum formation protein
MIILASASPRRKEILQTAGIEFEVRVAEVEEKITPGQSPEETVKDLARQKALAVAKANPQTTVIGADTIVVLEGEILGKPRDWADAIKMLKSLSGKTHSVFTGVCLVKDGEENRFFEETKVEFYNLSNEEIEAYVDTGEPMDKAGAYGIQGKGCLLVKRIEGDYFNVVGLPVGKLVRELM